jgi:hypothetical protein
MLMIAVVEVMTQTDSSFPAFAEARIEKNISGNVFEEVTSLENRVNGHETNSDPLLQLEHKSSKSYIVYSNEPPIFYDEDRVVLVTELLYEPHETESILPIIANVSSYHLEDKAIGYSFLEDVVMAMDSDSIQSLEENFNFQQED